MQRKIQIRKPVHRSAPAPKDVATTVDTYHFETEEARLRFEAKSARACTQPRDEQTGRFVSKEIGIAATDDDEQTKIFLGNDGDEVIPVDEIEDEAMVYIDEAGSFTFVPIERITQPDRFNRHEQTYSLAQPMDEEEAKAKEAMDAWCRANRRLCVPFDWSTQGYNLPQAPRPWMPRSLRRTRHTRPVQAVTFESVDA